MTAASTELHAVAVRRFSVLEDEDELVLAPVHRPHAGAVLGPDADILELAEGGLSGCQVFGEVAPVGTSKVNGAGAAVRRHVFECLSEKGGELLLGHLA